MTSRLPYTVPPGHYSFDSFWVPAEAYPDAGVLCPVDDDGDDDENCRAPPSPRHLFIPIGVWYASSVVAWSSSSSAGTPRFMRLVYARQCIAQPLGFLPVFCTASAADQFRRSVIDNNASLSWEDFELITWRYAIMLCELATLPTTDAPTSVTALMDDYGRLVTHYGETILFTPEARWLAWLIFGLFVTPALVAHAPLDTNIVLGRVCVLPDYLRHVVRLEKQLYAAQLAFCTRAQVQRIVEELPGSLGVRAARSQRTRDDDENGGEEDVFAIAPTTGLRCGHAMLSDTISLHMLVTDILPTLYASEMEEFFIDSLNTARRTATKNAGAIPDYVARVIALGREVYRVTERAFETRGPVPRIPGLHCLALEHRDAAIRERQRINDTAIAAARRTSRWLVPRTHAERMLRLKTVRETATVADMEDLFRDETRLPPCMRRLVASMRSSTPALKNDDRVAMASWLTVIMPESMDTPSILRAVVGERGGGGSGGGGAAVAAGGCISAFTSQLSGNRRRINAVRPQGCHSIISGRSLRPPESLLECPYATANPTATVRQCQTMCARDLGMPDLRHPIDALLYILRR